MPSVISAGRPALVVARALGPKGPPGPTGPTGPIGPEGPAGGSSGNFIQAGTGAVTRTTQNKVRERVTVEDFGAVADGTTDVTAAIQLALNSGARVVGLATVGTYIVNGTLTIPSNTTFHGLGIGKTILKKTGTGTLLYMMGTTQKFDISITDMSLDVNLVTNGVGIQAEYVTRFTVARVEIKNIPFWGIHLGVNNGEDTAYRNQYCLIEDCAFAHSTQTYEQLLVHNSQHVTVRRCSFTDSTTGSHGIGVYQIYDDIWIDNCVVSNFTNSPGMYYGVPGTNLTISNSTFSGNNTGIQGANISDNGGGTFGFTNMSGLAIENNRFFRNTAVACQIGGVVGGKVTGNYFFESGQSGLIITRYNTFGGAPGNIASQLNISNNIFDSNNNSFGSGLGNPAIGVYYDGGAWGLDALFTGNHFFDRHSPHTQMYPMVFNGAATWYGIIVTANQMQSYGGATSIAHISGSSAASTFLVSNNINYT